jgi:hypothetical protein
MQGIHQSGVLHSPVHAITPQYLHTVSLYLLYLPCLGATLKVSGRLPHQTLRLSLQHSSPGAGIDVASLPPER